MVRIMKRLQLVVIVCPAFLDDQSPSWPHNERRPHRGLRDKLRLRATKYWFLDRLHGNVIGPRGNVQERRI
ncbi:hypothetical protein F4677DRAFT_410283 [Hypoxylon crocopeplum]|nr:hypothetical protein F4677DRAFT_410283 [Hypoxylon crocopeplum]